jgi:hypothetical protein
MAPSSQELEPPANPGRFNLSKTIVALKLATAFNLDDELKNVILVVFRSFGVFTHGVIPGSSHTQALGISSPRIEAHLMGPGNDGETQWNTMSD